MVQPDVVRWLQQSNVVSKHSPSVAFWRLEDVSEYLNFRFPRDPANRRLKAVFGFMPGTWATLTSSLALFHFSLFLFSFHFFIYLSFSFFTFSFLSFSFLSFSFLTFPFNIEQPILNYFVLKPMMMFINHIISLPKKNRRDPCW